MNISFKPINVNLRRLELKTKIFNEIKNFDSKQWNSIYKGKFKAFVYNNELFITYFFENLNVFQIYTKDEIPFKKIESIKCFNIDDATYLIKNYVPFMKEIWQ